MSHKITILQANLLRKIAESEYTAINGAIPQSIDDIGAIWADTIIEDKQDAGTFTSLNNAGLVTYSGAGNDSTVELTPEGFAIYKSLI